MGELNSKLIGMIFVMKFQVAAMARADMSEAERKDFCLFVDEFQNFATESFESILSEARKYRLNLVLGNQFMTQLTDKIREAIIGNVGTIISGRIGVTDAELMVKKFSPTFDAEDLTKLPNYQAIASVMINNVPSAPFSMSLLPPMGKDNPQLADAMKRLSATKYGQSRPLVEKDIFARLDTPAKPVIPARQGPRPGAPSPAAPGAGSGGTSFLDEWLAKRQQMNSPKPSIGGTAPQRPTAPPPLQPSPFAQQPMLQTVQTGAGPSMNSLQPPAPTALPVSTPATPVAPAPQPLSTPITQSGIPAVAPVPASPVIDTPAVIEVQGVNDTHEDDTDSQEEPEEISVSFR
jgi:hypothetical protein